MYTAEAIANYFLDKSEQSDSSINLMELQRLVYFAHGWYLGLESKPLINEPIQAWSFGPVIYQLYRDFKEFGLDPIQGRAKSLGSDLKLYEPSIEMEKEDDDEAKYTKGFLDRIWEIYGQYTYIQLSNLSHEKGSPWHKVCMKFQGNIPSGINIPESVICDYFCGLKEP